MWILRQNVRALWEQVFGERSRSFPWGLQIPVEWRACSGGASIGTRTGESRKQLWAENIKINSQIIWTIDAVLCSKLHLQLSMISITMKIKLLWTLKEKGSWPGVDSLLAFPGTPLSVYVLLSFYLAVGHVFPASLNVKRDVFSDRGSHCLCPRMEI